ncbi:unnamed protein product [Adineta ricciae]|uniref:Uncharacterized protein n=1 Tax=Adineta ricciae TaxID=249248 RepID=A0A813ZWK6_ADIRI|nr:unnamed protein product [Adineta ricciae]
MLLGGTHAPNDVLCEDVLLELFQYFYVDELFYTFDGVINNFSSLLTICNVALHVRNVNTNFRKHILPYIQPKNVLSIRIPNMYQMASVDLSQFKCLGLLVLHNVTDHNWPRNLPLNIKSLIVHVRSKHRNKVLKKALALDSIQRLEFNSTCLHFDKSNEALRKPSRVKQLIFNSQRCFIDYTFLLINMPDLQLLKANQLFYPHRLDSNRLRFSELHTLDLICKHLDIDEMISLVKNVAACSLRQCRLVNITNSLSSTIAVILISCYSPDFHR